MDDSRPKHDSVYPCQISIRKHGIPCGQFGRFYWDSIVSCWKIPPLPVVLLLTTNIKNWPLLNHMHTILKIPYFVSYFPTSSNHSIIYSFVYESQAHRFLSMYIPLFPTPPPLISVSPLRIRVKKTSKYL